MYFHIPHLSKWSEIDYESNYWGTVGSRFVALDLYYSKNSFENAVFLGNM